MHSETILPFFPNAVYLLSSYVVYGLNKVCFKMISLPEYFRNENLWLQFVCNLYADYKQYRTKHELKLAISNSWRNIRSNVLEMFSTRTRDWKRHKLKIINN